MLEQPAPEGASDLSRAEAKELLISWREISPALSLRAAECEGAHRAAMDEARLLAECASLKTAFILWERRTGGLLTPDASVKVVDAEGMRAAAELASAQLPVGEALIERAAQLRVLLKSYNSNNMAHTGGTPLASVSATTEAGLPPHVEMLTAIKHVRTMAMTISLATSNAPPPYDPSVVNSALMKLKSTEGLTTLPKGLDMFQTEEGTDADDQVELAIDPFPLDNAPEPPPFDHSIDDRDAGLEFSRTVLEHVNFIRTKPAEAAAEFKTRLGECYEGKTLSPPWQIGGKPIHTTEGRAALDDLVKRLEATKPLPPLSHLDELYTAAEKKGSELAAGRKASPIEDRLRGLGTWSGVAGEMVEYGIRARTMHTPRHTPGTPSSAAQRSLPLTPHPYPTLPYRHAQAGGDRNNDVIM